mmetsp:Transcript_82/g.263  ORF Transcript_82/g.263 Transcript_82/m.263 type:complete len:262 (+) Transcript_82:790-1575(+)
MSRVAALSAFLVVALLGLLGKGDLCPPPSRSFCGSLLGCSVRLALAVQQICRERVHQEEEGCHVRACARELALGPAAQLATAVRTQESELPRGGGATAAERRARNAAQLPPPLIVAGLHQELFRLRLPMPVEAGLAEVRARKVAQQSRRTLSDARKALRQRAAHSHCFHAAGMRVRVHSKLGEQVASVDGALGRGEGCLMLRSPDHRRHATAEGEASQGHRWGPMLALHGAARGRQLHREEEEPSARHRTPSLACAAGKEG